MGYEKTKGVILKVRDFKEKDKLLYVATGDRGKITLIAKGSRGKSSRTMSITQPMMFCDLVYFAGKNIHTMNEIVPIHSFPELLKDFELITYGTYYLELMDLAMEDVEPNEPLFMEFIRSLYLLESGAIEKKLLTRAFEIKVLLLTGNQPSPVRHGQYIPDGPRALIRFMLNNTPDRLSEVTYTEEDLDYVGDFTGELLKECFQRRPRSLDILDVRL